MRALKKTPSLISVLGPATKKDSLAGDMMVDGVMPPPTKKVGVLLLLAYSRPLVLSRLADEGAPSWQQEHRGSRPRQIID